MTVALAGDCDPWDVVVRALALWSEAAVFVNPRDDTALLRALSRTIDDPARRRSLSQQAFIRARRYAAETMVRRYIELYRSVLAARGRREAVACVS